MNFRTFPIKIAIEPRLVVDQTQNIPKHPQILSRVCVWSLAQTILLWKAASFGLQYLVVKIKLLACLFIQTSLMDLKKISISVKLKMFEIMGLLIFTTLFPSPWMLIDILPACVFRICILIWIEITQFFIHGEKSYRFFSKEFGLICGVPMKSIWHIGNWLYAGVYRDTKIFKIIFRNLIVLIIYVFLTKSEYWTSVS